MHRRSPTGCDAGCPRQPAAASPTQAKCRRRGAKRCRRCSSVNDRCRGGAGGSRRTAREKRGPEIRSTRREWAALGMTQIATINPATGETVETFAALTDPEIDDRLDAAHRASLSWRKTPIEQRVAVLARAAELLDERKAEYGRLMTLEMGK